MNLAELSLPELKNLLQVIPAEINRREKSEKQRIRKELEALVAKSGFSLGELFGDESEDVKKVRTVPVKYRHPENPTQEWSGRGRQPRWVAEFLVSGGTLQQLEI